MAQPSSGLTAGATNGYRYDFEQPIAELERRLQDAVSDMAHYVEYDYVLVNDDFDEALLDLAAIMRARRQRRDAQVARQGCVIAALLSE